MNAPREGVRFKESYDMKEELGKGGFGTVRRCVSKGAQRVELAAKINNTPDKAKSQKEECLVSAELSMILSEDWIGTRPSRHVINLFDAIAEGDIIYNIYEIASGGDLNDEIKRREFFGVNDAREAFRQIVEGVNHVHMRGWLHCDLKPLNILIEHKKRAVYKIADFGLCHRRHLPDPNLPNCSPNDPRLTKSVQALTLQKRALGLTPLPKPPDGQPKREYGEYYMYIPSLHGCRGTLSYNCPQKFATGTDQFYDAKSDWWSVAVILYEMLCGYQPFSAGSAADYAALFAAGNFLEFPNPEWDDPELDQAKILLGKMFEVDYEKRYEYEDIVRHSFLVDHPRQPLPQFVAHDFTLEQYNQNKFEKRNRLLQAAGLPPIPPQQQAAHEAPP